MATRTFLAIDIDGATRDALLRACRRIDSSGDSARWVAPQNMHVTVNFLGEISDTRLAEVCETAKAAAAELPPFDFDVRGVLAVPPQGRLRMLWAGVEEPTGRMVELHVAMTGALKRIGFHPDGRDFRPHVTLARLKSPRKAGAVRTAARALVEECFGTSRAEAITLYAGKLTTDGPIYTPLAHLPLQN